MGALASQGILKRTYSKTPVYWMETRADEDNLIKPASLSILMYLDSQKTTTEFTFDQIASAITGSKPKTIGNELRTFCNANIVSCKESGGHIVYQLIKHIMEYKNIGEYKNED